MRGGVKPTHSLPPKRTLRFLSINSELPLAADGDTVEWHDVVERDALTWHCTGEDVFCPRFSVIGDLQPSIALVRNAYLIHLESPEHDVMRSSLPLDSSGWICNLV